MNNYIQQINNLPKEKFYALVITLWLLIGSLYLSHTLFNFRAHDVNGHIACTKLLVIKGVYPNPSEGWETFQPPLFYTIASKLNGNALKNNNSTSHISLVRYLSVLCGAVFVFCMVWFLNLININNFAKLLVTLFTVTTLKFASTFTTYSNDPLAIMFSALILVFSYKLYRNWSGKDAAWLLVFSTLGLYAKSLCLGSILVVSIICLRNLLKAKDSNNSEKKILLVFLVSIALFFPWLKFHNYKHSGKYFPINIEWAMNKDLSLNKMLKSLSYVSELPFSISKWSEPWLYPLSKKGISHPASKNKDYLSYFFVSSVIGEWILQSPSKIFIWLVLLAHLFIGIFALKTYKLSKENIVKLSLLVIVVSHIVHLVNVSRFAVPVLAPVMDFRMIGYIWLPWAVLFGNLLLVKNDWQDKIKKIMMLAIALQIYILIVVEGGKTNF